MFVQDLISLGRDLSQVVVLVSDGVSDENFAEFQRAFPERIFHFGVGVANMFSAAAGVALSGKLPVILVSADLVPHGFGPFYSDIVLPNLNVKVVVFGNFDLKKMAFGESLMAYENLRMAADQYGPGLVKEG